MLTDYPLVMVTWQDHSASSGWLSKTDYIKSDISVVTTIGWLVHKDRHKYVIHNSMIDREDVSGGESVIIRKNIIDEYELTIEG